MQAYLGKHTSSFHENFEGDFKGNVFDVKGPVFYVKFDSDGSVDHVTNIELSENDNDMDDKDLFAGKFIYHMIVLCSPKPQDNLACITRKITEIYVKNGNG